MHMENTLYWFVFREWIRLVKIALLGKSSRILMQGVWWYTALKFLLKLRESTTIFGVTISPYRPGVNLGYSIEHITKMFWLPRVHPEYILGEYLPYVNSTDDIDKEFWDRRFEQINNFEKTIAENGTLIFKFFLNLSKEEQKNRLIRRLNKPEKNWKFSPGDLDERELWGQYMQCYEDILNRSSKPHAPWFAIPADNKPAARLIVASILLQEISKYKDIKEPELDAEISAKISEYKERLQNE